MAVFKEWMKVKWGPEPVGLGSLLEEEIGTQTRRRGERAGMRERKSGPQHRESAPGVDGSVCGGWAARQLEQTSTMTLFGNRVFTGVNSQSKIRSHWNRMGPGPAQVSL